MNEITDKTNIKNLIYEIRGKQVMLDSDLAKLYKCKNGTKEINQAVNRNTKKFLRAVKAKGAKSVKRKKIPQNKVLGLKAKMFSAL